MGDTADHSDIRFLDEREMQLWYNCLEAARQAPKWFRTLQHLRLEDNVIDEVNMTTSKTIPFDQSPPATAGPDWPLRDNSHPSTAVDQLHSEQNLPPPFNRPQTPRSPAPLLQDQLALSSPAASFSQLQHEIQLGEDISDATKQGGKNESSSDGFSSHYGDDYLCNYISST